MQTNSAGGQKAKGEMIGRLPAMREEMETQAEARSGKGSEEAAAGKFIRDLRTVPDVLEPECAISAAVCVDLPFQPLWHSRHGEPRWGWAFPLQPSSPPPQPSRDPSTGPQGAHYLGLERSTPAEHSAVVCWGGGNGWQCWQGHEPSTSKARLFCWQQRQQGTGAAAFSNLCSLVTAPLPAQDCELDRADQ